MEDKGPIIGYWKIRGLLELAKLIMEFGKKPYQMVYYQRGPRPQLSGKQWADKKYTLGLDFPDLPYLIDGDLQFSQSMTIYIYLMQKYVPELQGKTEAEKIKVQESLCVLWWIKETLTQACYDSKQKIPEAFQTIASKIKQVEEKLGKNEWFMGDSPCVSDLLLMELTDQLQMMTEGSWLKDHPILEAHNARTKRSQILRSTETALDFLKDLSMAQEHRLTMSLMIIGNNGALALSYF